MKKPNILIVFFVLIVNVMFSSVAYSSDLAIIKEAWLNLDNTENRCPELYDYFPNGGMRSFYCHIKVYLDYKDILKASGMIVFRKGPHTHKRLNLNSRYDFGYYNKEFVIWLKNNAIPASKDPAFKQRTKSLYDRYVKDLARTYHKTHELLFEDMKFMETEKNTYLNHLKNQTLPEFYVDKYYPFKDLHKKGYDGNVVKSAVLFWLRRSIDGTEKEFFEGLEALIQAY